MCQVLLSKAWKERTVIFITAFLVKKLQAKKLKVTSPCLARARHDSISLPLGPVCMTAFQVTSLFMLSGDTGICISSYQVVLSEGVSCVNTHPVSLDVQKLYAHKACGWMELACSHCAGAEHAHSRSAGVHSQCGAAPSVMWLFTCMARGRSSLVQTPFPAFPISPLLNLQSLEF